MYHRSAPYYDALYSFKDYPAAARSLHDAIRRRRPYAQTLLDVACGTGLHLAELRQWYEVAGVDINPVLLDVARQRLVNVPLYQQDMTMMSTGKRYDVVTCLFSSIAYVRTFERLKQAVARLADHLTPGGLLVIEPYFSPEQYWTNRVTLNVVNQPELKITWMYTSPAPVENVATLDIHHMVGTPSGVETFVERHELGLFTSQQFQAALQEAGMEAELEAEGFFGRGVYLASHRSA